MVEADDIDTLRGLGDTAILRAALQLEEGAVARYIEHGARTADPRLFVYWEALRRNETEHRDQLRTVIAAREGGGTTR